MTKKLRLISGSLVLLLAIAMTSVFWTPQNTTTEQNINEQRKAHEAMMAKTPFKETLKWDKKTRKQNGLPPNRYFEQMYELTMNPTTGKLDNAGLSIIREELLEARQLQRNPGEAGNDWEERGPNNIGGRTRVIMFDPNDASNNTVYAGGVSGGLWINTNISSSSSQWVRVEGVPGNLSVTSITVDPNNSNRWFVGTGEQYTGGDVVGNGVYVTTNGGTTWNALNIPAAGVATFEYSATNLFLSGLFYVNDVLAWDNNGSTELFVGVGAHVYGDASSPTNWAGLQTAGLYHSTDAGQTWNRIESSNMSFSFGGGTYYFIPNDLEVGADNRLWMGTITTPGIGGGGGGRVFSSTTGNTWTEAGASPLTDSNRVELEPSSTNPNKLYALTQGVSAPVHIYTTTNGFGSISSAALPNDADTGIPANDFCRGQAFYDLVIEADPANDNVVYVGGIDLFKSTNGGSSWSQLSHWYGGFGQPNNVHADQHSIAFGNNSSSQMLFGNDGGVYYTGNAGGTIGVRNNGYNVTQFVKAGIGPDGNGDTLGVFSAGAQDNGTQAFRDGNASPGINSSEELSDGDGFYTFVDKDGQYMIATYVYNVIYRFSLPWNGLGRRQGGATSLLSDQSTGDFVNQMGYDSDANRLLTNGSSGTGNRIRSINVASNSNGTLTNTALSAKPTAFRASPFEANTWYVGLANGGLLRLTNVNNTSATFSIITTPFIGSVSSVRYGETANDIFVTIHNYGVTSVWATDNGGSSWVSKEGNLPNIPVRDLLQNPLNRDEAILATQLGVWSTADFNATNPTWTQAYNGMSDVSVTSLDYWDVSGDDTDNKVIASTYGRGVFTGKFTATTVPDNEAPSVPQNLVTSNITTNSLNLNWDASTDNIGVSEYEIFQDGISIGTSSTTSFSVSGLSSSTSYSFTVLARDASSNESAQSAATQATTLDPDTTAPSIPANLSSSNVTASSVDLSWSASTDNVAVADYDVFQDGNLIATVSSTSYQVTGLSQFTTYLFSVSARDTSGNVSAQSNTISVTTDVQCTPTTSNFNSNTLNHSGSGSTSTTLNFTGGTHEDASFTVSELNARTGGNPNRRFIERVVISYVDGNGVSQNYGTFSGDTTNTVNVTINGIVQSVSVALSDALGGTSNISIALSSVDSCETLNCTDSDGDGVCDENDVCPDLDDNLIGMSCDDGDNCTINDVYGPDCNCAGTYADSDGDGVCDADDICPGGDDAIDLNGNDVPDACDCTSGTGSFSSSILNHSGSGSSSVNFSFTNLSKDVTFSISGLDARVSGNPRNRYEEVATVTYVNANGQTQTFNVYSGANQNTANVTISNFISEVTVSLSNGVSGSTTSLSISLSSINFCTQNSGATTNNQTSSTINNSGSNTSFKDFAVFPNPAKTELNIRLGLDVGNNPIDVMITIYDLRGKIIQRQQWSSVSNPIFKEQIDISRLNGGLYLIGIESSNGLKEMHKLIKR